MHVPQVPEVQFVGIVTSASSACSTSVFPGTYGACPRRFAPFRNRTTLRTDSVFGSFFGSYRMGGHGTTSAHILVARPAAGLFVEV